MVAFNHDHHIPTSRSNPVPPVNRLAERVRHYFDQHPEAAREEFLLHALRMEIHFREQREARKGPGTARREGGGTNRRLTTWPAISDEDIRIHAWVAERLALIHHERYGLWPRLRRLIFGNRVGRLLGLSPERTGKT